MNVNNFRKTIESVTPKGDLSWYIKWASSIIIIFGMMLSSANIYPMNIWVHLFGVSGWMIVGMLWHDRALIFLNGVAIFVFESGLVNHYYG